MRGYHPCQILGLQVQDCDSPVPSATSNSMPLAEMGAGIPRAQGPMRINHFGLEVQQSQLVSVIPANLIRTDSKAWELGIHGNNDAEKEKCCSSTGYMEIHSG